MSLESISHLAELTGKAPDTVKRAAGELGLKPVIRGRRHLYESKEMLPYLYGVTEAPDIGQAQGAKKYDYNKEKTRLTIAQRAKVELETAIKAGELVPASDVLLWATNMIANCKMRLLAIPGKLAPEAAILDDPKQVKSLADEFINEALEELHEYDGTSGRGA